jgi:F-type H+-transporting ATPase subunit b
MPADIVAPDAPEGAATAGHGGGHDSHHPIGLDTTAINWFDFNYLQSKDAYVAEHHVKPGPPVVALFVNFILLLSIIYLIARKPLAAFLQSRSDNVREGLAEATKMLDEANERLADYSARLERMDEEMTRLREEFIAAGEAERDRLVAEAGARAERMRRDAETRLSQEFSQLREELRLEAINKAVEASTELLKTSVTGADQRRLADEYLTQLNEQGVGQ